MKSIIDDTDSIGARLKEIERTAVPEPAVAHESASSPLYRAGDTIYNGVIIRNVDEFTPVDGTCDIGYGF